MSIPVVKVPPRRGQRVKSILLPPFAGGNAFSLVSRNEQVGIIHKRHGSNQSFVWFEYDLKPTLVNNCELTPIAIESVSKHAFQEYEAVIGGIGKHLRWKVLMPNKRMHGATRLIVDNVSDIAKFRDFVETKLVPFAQATFEYDNNKAVLTVPDINNLGTVAAAIHYQGYPAHAEDPAATSGAKMAIERYDRSEHMWWNQEQKKAGPLRDVHRWTFDYIPSDWTQLPFTWQSMCENIQLDPLTESQYLPRPLRDFYITTKIAVAKQNKDDDLVHKLTELRGQPAVTCRLSENQNRQLLEAGYWCLIAPFNHYNVRLCRLLRFRYTLHGYTAREIGEYKQTARNLGHGATIRKFKNKPQYRAENLSTDVLNRIYQRDGSMRGSGFKGTRGKYGHEDFEKYIPAKRMHRTVVQERRMRQSSSNPFAEYKRDTVQKAARDKKK